MSDPHRDYLSTGNANNSNAQLPNATATLVLGILSIVVCFICGIIALVISNKDIALYKAILNFIQLHPIIILRLGVSVQSSVSFYRCLA
jgi:hypothetical protein